MRVFAAIAGHNGRLRRTLLDTGPERRGARRVTSTGMGTREGVATSQRAIHRITGQEVNRTVSGTWRNLESEAHRDGVVEWPKRNCSCGRSSRLWPHHCVLQEQLEWECPSRVSSLDLLAAGDISPYR